MFNHSVAADAYVWPGHLHSIQCDPERHKKYNVYERGSETEEEREKEKT